MKNRQFDAGVAGTMTAPAVMVTGASSGIGEATVLLLDSRGYRVFAGVRRDEDARRLVQRASERLVPVMLDVTDSVSIAAALRQVELEVREGGLLGLVNNAGISVCGVLEFLDINALRQQLEVNLIGTAAVISAFMPLIRRARGRIVNISSDSGLLAAPLVGPYSMSKFGIEALSDTLRRELRQWGMSVVIVEPGAIATPMWDKGASMAEELRDSLSPEAATLYGVACGKYQAYLDRGAASAIPVERVAVTVHRALTSSRPRSRYQVGTDAKFARLAARYLPTTMVDWLVAKSFS